jgi:hypothetical protein
MGCLTPTFRSAVDLVSRRAQSVDAVAVQVAFPRYKFIDGDVVENTLLIDRHPATAHRFDDGGLAPHGPSLPGARQFRYSQNVDSIFRVCRIDHACFPYRCRSQKAIATKPARKIIPAKSAMPSGVMPFIPTRYTASVEDLLQVTLKFGLLDACPSGRCSRHLMPAIHELLRLMPEILDASDPK